MTEIILLCAMAIAVTEVYVRTRRPKRYALINSALGVGSMLFFQHMLTDEITVTAFNTAFSAIMGVPASLLMLILGYGG